MRQSEIISVVLHHWDYEHNLFPLREDPVFRYPIVCRYKAALVKR